MNNFPKVENMNSPRSGAPVANQFIIRIGSALWFQSYNSLIAKYENGVLTVDQDYFAFSVTTNRYMRQFSGKDTQEIRDGISSGTILTENFNA